MLQRHFVFLTAFLALPAACTTTGGSDTEFSDPGGSANTGGNGVAGSNPNGGGSGAGALGGGHTGGNGGDSNHSGDTCVAESAKAQPAPVDVIWAVDGSGSMAEEIERIRTQINDDFLQILMISGLDWNLTMIARRGTAGGLLQSLCVNSPPAGANCGDGPSFQHINCGVHSNNALASLAMTYTGADPGFTPSVGSGPCTAVFNLEWDQRTWIPFMRLEATKVLVVVTDDESDVSASEFDNWTMQQGTMFGTPQNRKYVLHGIIGGRTGNPSAPCATADAPGLIYQELANLTGGTVASICENNWTPIFNTIASSIVNRLSCEYPVPDPPAGETLDPNKVNVVYTPSGSAPETILRDETADCDGGADGWQWGPNHETIVLCGDACARVKAGSNATLDIEFGCEGEVVK